ncbi:MAG TPA: xanthine dehydrogenase family protein [Anaerolineae bacterium]|nr:xanthine dehydrogenase family protein [Anaerolineae bacterium]HID85563.1 aldehyde oxidase [Anaerolineales bacterium]HIQ08512.1 aldehyde oxidase [Anaerolineaceae bacterium]
MTRIIGQPFRRVDVLAKVTGKAQYPGDIDLPNQCYMKIKFAERAHAIVKRIDTSKAEALEGVIAVFTAKDVPVNEYGLMEPDQPVLCGPGSSKPYADRVRFVGDQVALVVAETPEIAAKGVEFIEVDYEDLPVVDDPLAAMQPDAPLVHPERGSNVFVEYRIRKGDVEEGFAQADVIVEGEYRTPTQEHAYLQPEAGLAYVDEEGRVTVIVAGQWAHEDREQIAHALGLPEERVRVIYPAIGGAFGGREDMSVQIVLALAAWRLHQQGIDRPVKIVWSREESIIGHGKRHPFIIRAKWGGTKEGKIVAARMELIADGGAYIYTSTKVLGNAVITCTGPYEIPHVWVDAYGVYTNHLPSAAFRGFGAPQGIFAAEMQMNKLAEALGMDPVELRMRNVFREGSLMSVGTPVPEGVTMAEVLAETARAAGWEQGPQGWHRPEDADERWPGPAWRKPAPSYIRRGIGLAIGFKNVGFSFGFPEHSWARVELYGGTEIERAVVYHAGAEVGQGAHSAFVQMAAEALGISPDKVTLVVSDTGLTESSGSASASRMTFMAGNAIKGACERALAKWHNEKRPAVAEYTYHPPQTTPFDPETGHSKPNFTYGYVAAAVALEVDSDTGQVRPVEVILGNDVGQAINPQQVEGQIEGGVVQALGWTLLEHFLYDEQGRVVTDRLSTYLIPTALDVPVKVRPLILEYPDPLGPWGARGMGEMPFLPVAPAVMQAMRQAVGVWFDDFPLTPERVLRGLGAFS